MWSPGQQQRPLGSECLRRTRGLLDGVWQGPGTLEGGVSVWPFVRLVFGAGA